MNVIFADLDVRKGLLPLTYTKHSSKLRVGIDTLEEKWMSFLEAESVSHLGEDYLQCLYQLEISHDNLLINPLVIPSKSIIDSIKYLDINSALWTDSTWIAARLDKEQIEHYRKEELPGVDKVFFKEEITFISRPWHLFQNNKRLINEDFERLSKGKKSIEAHESTTLIGGKIFIEAGAQVINCSLNALDGPIYIGKNAKVLDGVFIKGPFALCEGATVNMGAKIRDGSTIGPHCKVGGEVNNSILQGYSNKGHDGFMGNSVIGEWCNLGADTNTSNLKNNYGDVKVWSYDEEKMVSTESQFCGLIMADHGKCGINTMLNTGTVVGVSANIFGSDFPPKHIPSFSWGGASGFDEFKLNKAFEVAERMMIRRNLYLDDNQKKVLEHIFSSSKKYRQ